MSVRNNRTAKARRSGGHPARDALAAEVREFGLMLMTTHEDDEMMQHGTAALWVSAHGRIFTRRGGDCLPAGLEIGERGKCFANAQHVARSCDFRYAEGFAGPSPAGRWTLHAWNLDSRGRVIDPTWPDDYGTCRYLGIEFGDLPDGEQAGISLLVDLLGGKLVTVNHKTGAVTLLDGESELAQMVKADGGFVAVGEGIPGSRQYARALRDT